MENGTHIFYFNDLDLKAKPNYTKVLNLCGYKFIFKDIVRIYFLYMNYNKKINM